MLKQFFYLLLNCHQNEFSGSNTGSISPNMIKSLGVKYIIIGHSENRSSGDSDSIINTKTAANLLVEKFLNLFNIIKV